MAESMGSPAINPQVGSSNPDAVNVTQIGGSSVTLGQKVMAQSIPVVLASDQSSLTANQGTPNTAANAWPTTITDLTNTANILKFDGTAVGQNAVIMAGTGLTVNFSTTSAQAVASTDALNYKWVSVQINLQGGSSNVNFQVSNDNTNWFGCALLTSTGGTTQPVTSTGSTGIFHGPLMGRYFRLNVTGIISGTTSGAIMLFSQTEALQTMGVSAAQSGQWPTRTQDGSGNNITSNSSSFGRGLDINLLGVLGTAFTSAGILDVIMNDGTNKANILKSDGTAAGQNAQLVAGTGYTTTTLTLNAGSPNSAWFDMLNFPQMSFEILANAGGLSLSFGSSGDASETNETAVNVKVSGSGGFTSSTTNATLTLGYERVGRYFRFKSNASGGNTITIAATFFTSTTPSNDIRSTQQGTWTVGSNSATGSAVPANAFYGSGSLAGTLTGFQMTGGSTDAILNSALDVAAFGYVNNGTNWDRQRSNLTANLVATGTTSTQSNQTITTYNARCLTLLVNISAFTSGTLTVVISGVSTNYTYTMLTGAALGAQALTIMMIGPGLTAATNTVANAPLPRTISVTATVSGGGSLTYGIDYVLSN